MTATRAGRLQGRLARASWLLVLAGSCAYKVDLPTAMPVGDAGANPDGAAAVPDTSFDQSSPSERTWPGRPDGSCMTQRVVTTPLEMIIALDRSSTMQRQFDGTTRLQAAQQAVQELTLNHSSVQFGLEQFPSPRDCNGLTCCAGQISVQPAPMPYSSTAIKNQMTCAPGDSGCPVAGNDSPSHAALNRCCDFFTNEGSWEPFSQFVLLITDRDPSCAGDASSDTSLCAQAMLEASKLRGIGVSVFVVSLNNDIQNTSCLASIAADPSRSAGNSQFKAVADQQQLRDALSAVMDSVEVNACRFRVGFSPSSPPADPKRVEVIVNNNKVVPFDSSGQDGWSFSDDTSREIVLSGSWCKTFTAAPDTATSTPVVIACSP